MRNVDLKAKDPNKINGLDDVYPDSESYKSDFLQQVFGLPEPSNELRENVSRDLKEFKTTLQN